MTRQMEAHALLIGVEERIRELLRYRQWYRTTPWAAEWTDLRRANDVELRALLKLARNARRTARQTTFIDHAPDATYATEGIG